MSDTQTTAAPPVKAVLRKVVPKGQQVAAVNAALKTEVTGTVEVQGVQVESVIGAANGVPDLAGELLGDGNNDVQEASQALVQSTTTPTGVTTQSQNDGRFSLVSNHGFEGDWDTSDIKHPQLKIVQGSGPLSQTYQHGTILLGDEELMGPPDLKNPANTPLLRFVPVQLKKQYREKLSQDDYAAGQMPQIVNTIEEVEALGGTTQWIDGQQPSWAQSCRALFLVQQPEGSLHPGFSFELDGKFYAPAVFFAAGTQWTNVAKVIFSAQTSLYEGKPPNRRVLLPKFVWSWQTCKKKAGDNLVFTATVRILTKEVTGPELRSFASEMLGEAAEAANIEA